LEHPIEAHRASCTGDWVIPVTFGPKFTVNLRERHGFRSVNLALTQQPVTESFDALQW